MSRPWPFNPQPSFPPLPTSPSTSPVHLREALRSITAEVERQRPETSPPESSQGLRRRKLEETRAELESLSPKCDKCHDLESEHAVASSKFFKEIEHLRRALAKMLDVATKYMPAGALRSLKESLQLDVRYLTKPEEGEGGPLPPVPVVEAVDYTELIEQLKRQIAEQQKEIQEKKYTIQDLEEELRRLQEQLAQFGHVVSPTRKREKRRPEHKEMQTDPWMPFPPKQEVVHVVEKPTHVEPTPTAVKPKKEKKPKPVDQPDSDSSDEPVVAEVKKPKKVAKKDVEVPEKVVSSGIDPDLLRKLQAELDLLKMKLASAERELAKMDGLKAEIERLKQLVSDRDQKIEELEEEIRRLKAKPPPKEVKQEVKQTTKPQEVKEKKKEKRLKQDPAPTPKTPTQPTVQQAEKEDVPPPLVEEEKPPEPEEVPSESSEEESEESIPPKTFEDKCVGNGPGAWSLLDEPIVVKGKALLKEELNKTGKCYERYQVEQPTLGLTNTPMSQMTTIDLDPLARLNSTGGVGVYAGGSMLGGVQFASFATRSPGRLGSTWPAEAEPYLTQVWEQHPKGHRAPVKRELIKLGAISPVAMQKASTLQSVDATVKPMSPPTMKLPEGWGIDATLKDGLFGATLKDETMRSASEVHD